MVRITILSIHQQMLPVLLWVLSDQHLNTVVRNVLPARECMCHSHYGQRLVVDMCEISFETYCAKCMCISTF